MSQHVNSADNKKTKVLNLRFAKYARKTQIARSSTALCEFLKYNHLMDIYNHILPSREHQRADWKLRHKAICGKPMMLTDAQASANPKTKPDCQYPQQDPALSLEIIGPTVNN